MKLSLVFLTEAADLLNIDSEWFEKSIYFGPKVISGCIFDTVSLSRLSDDIVNVFLIDEFVLLDVVEHPFFLGCLIEFSIDIHA